MYHPCACNGCWSSSNGSQGSLLYKKVESLNLADALSRAHLQKYLTNAEQLEINFVEHVISDQQLPKFVEATKQDEILLEL